MVKARQPLCGLNLSNTIFRILGSTAVPSSESVDQFQLVQRAAASKEASVAAVAADENVILTECHTVVGDRTVDIATGQRRFECIQSRSDWLKGRRTADEIYCLRRAFSSMLIHELPRNW